VAAPLTQCKKVTLVSSGKGDVGASKLTGEVFDIIERMPKLVEGMTGVDLTKVCLSFCLLFSSSMFGEILVKRLVQC